MGGVPPFGTARKHVGIACRMQERSMIALYAQMAETLAVLILIGALRFSN